MVSASVFAENALLSKWDKYKYTDLDCQAFVEAVLKDIGVRKKNGEVYNWRGSNSMYRNCYVWRGTVAEAVKKFGAVPLGAFVYIWKPDGAEDVGYTDGLGNCSHVGIYCGNGIVRDSTRSTKTGRNGVGSRPLSDFNRVTLFEGLDYDINISYNDRVTGLLESINKIREELKRMEVTIYDIAGSQGTIESGIQS